MKKILLTLFTAGFSIPFFASADSGMMGYGFNDGAMHWGSGFGWLFTLSWVVWLVVGIFLAVYLWQKINKK